MFYVHTTIVKDRQVVNSLGSALRTNKHEDAHVIVAYARMHACVTTVRVSTVRYCTLIVYWYYKYVERKEAGKYPN